MVLIDYINKLCVKNVDIHKFLVRQQARYFTVSDEYVRKIRDFKISIEKGLIVFYKRRQAEFDRKVMREEYSIDKYITKARNRVNMLDMLAKGQRGQRVWNDPYDSDEDYTTTHTYKKDDRVDFKKKRYVAGSLTEVHRPYVVKSSIKEMI